MTMGKSNMKNKRNRTRLACLALCLCILLPAIYACGGDNNAATDTTAVDTTISEPPANPPAPPLGGTEPYDESIKVTDMENLQYLAIHKGDWTLGSPWDVNNPDSFAQPGVDEILEAFGSRGTPSRRLAISYSFSYLHYPAEKVAAAIANLLALSEKNDVPVIMHIDGVNWWDTRPDLWNFWDESAPGYNPDNINNVERFNWDISSAVKIGWRHWGQQIRIPPAPNLAAPAFLAEQTKALDLIIPVIVKWYDALPADRKYLLGGVVFGWEISPYVQAFYYENGNELLDKPASEDPQLGGLVNNSQLWNTVALGYAAAQTLGIQTEGQITEETVDKICSFYLNFLIETAMKHGLDPGRVVTHSFWGGVTGKGGGHSGAASITGIQGVTPGWSWYDEDFKGIDKCIDMLDGAPWAAIEVKPWGLTAKVLENLFAHRNNRYVNIFNWEGIRDDRNTLNAIKVALQYGQAE